MILAVDDRTIIDNPSAEQNSAPIPFTTVHERGETGMTPAARLYANARAYEAMVFEDTRSALGIEYENRGTTYMRILAITRRYRRRERY